MELIIRNTTNQPIYDQIYSQIKAQIIAGKLSPGEALPSIRALAKDLRISVITTKRAYDELEADGFLYTVAGKGCFVAEKNLDLIREQKLKELEDHLDYKRWYYGHFHRDANPAERHTVLYDCIVRLGDELQPWDVA